LNEIPILSADERIFEGDSRRSVQLQIWEQMMSTSLRLPTPVYYRNASGVIVVYDVTDRSSFDQVRCFMKDIDEEGLASACCLLVGNKTDLTDRKVVETREGI
jgi:Ras-related protein Rab-1A